MTKQELTYSIRTFLICFAAWCCGALGLFAQEQEIALPDSADRLVLADSVRMAAVSDSLVTAAVNASLSRERFIPDPIRSMWLGLVFPGAGQIYNRKYWKLPIIYGGLLGCVYALTWNNQMLHDYSQAYLDIMDDDPGTASYNKFLHLGKQITPANEERYKQIFKSRKDKYRRWRDLSFFCMLGVYAVSVIDAYVDAELSSFDISKDLSLKVRPTVISNKSSVNPLYATSLGVNCSINF